VTPFERAALVGLGQSTPERTGTAVDALVDGTDAWSVLLTAGAWGVWRQAGAVAPRREVPEGHEPELRPEPQPAASGLIRKVLSRSPELIPALANSLHERGFCLPRSVLREALDSREPSLFPLFGPRERWLAEQNPAWAWALEAPVEDEHSWDEGTPEQRLGVLRTLRNQEPSAATAVLSAGFKGESADFRAKALAVLTEHPLPGDEGFFQTCLRDRAGKVRELATRAMCRLPESAFVKRMTERADALASLTRKKPSMVDRLRGKKGTATLDFELPTSFGADWAPDGMNPKGKRAHWLQHILRCVPAKHWCARFELSPHELVAAMVEQEEVDAVLLAAAWSGDLDFLDVLRAQTRVPMTQLTLDRDARIRILESGFDPQLIRGLAAPWPESVALAWLREVKADLDQPWWTDTLSVASTAIPSSLLEQARLGEHDSWPRALERAVEAYNDRIHQRRRMQELL
jgi:hypothetical protein